MSKSVKKVIGTVAPIAASFIPGIGPIAAAAIGAGGGLLSGGGLKGALLGGVTGGLGGGLGSQIGGSILGEGADALGSKLIGGALTGAAGGLTTGGGLKNALLGAGLGAAGSGLGYELNNGGLGNILGGGSGSPSSGGALDLSKDNSLLTAGNGTLSTSTPGITAQTGGGGLFGTSIGGSGGLSSYLNPAANVFSGIQSTDAQKKMQEQLLAAQGKVQQQLTPYTTAGANALNQLQSNLSAGFNPGDLTSDPGYQFQLQQGDQALNRSLGAQGNLFSGAALKAAQDYGQGLASTTYNDAYNRWLQQNQQLASQAGLGATAAGALNNSFENVGNVNANATLGQSNILNSTLSALLNGNGPSTYSATGTPNNTNYLSFLTDAQKKQMGLA